jgi:nicotinamidase-related amidase
MSRFIGDEERGSLRAMPVEWSRLVERSATALVISECQRDVVGDVSRLPALAEAAAVAVGRVAVLAGAARSAGVQVVHATAMLRADGKGANSNTGLTAGLMRRLTDDPPLVDPLEACEVVAEIAVDPRDVVLTRLHGMSPMHDTGLDPVLRNLGVRTIVVAGVSLNIAIPNLVMDAVNRGYSVVVPTDAVAGTPPEYCEAMLEHTIGYLAYLTTTEALARLWA